MVGICDNADHHCGGPCICAVLANEDDDPLFDSSREYLDQVDRFKRYQGKPTGRRGTPSMNPGAIRMRQRRAKLRRENG
jgi:hypothetical protein